jgi:cellulose biosynthesis protein BcsQ
MIGKTHATSKEQGDAYERLAASALERMGWQVEAMPPNHSSYDLKARRGNQKIVVQAKDLKTPASEAKIRQFAGFMTSADGHAFHEGWFVTRKGVSRNGRAFIASNPAARIKSWVLGGQFMGQTAGVSDAQQRRIGVYTFKGGVGKSKLALLLAGALAFRNKNVFIVDLNRAQNLYHLIGEDGLYVERGAGAGGTVCVLGREEWNMRKDEWKYGPVLDADFVIYDCPQFFEKSAERSFMANLHLVVSPLMLNTDSIGANHHVLRDTVSEVRLLNAQVPIAFLVNNLRPEQMQGPMMGFLKAATDVYDDRQQVYLLPLDRFAIPYQRTLEELGQQHALNPHSQVEMLFSRPGHEEVPWLRPATRLADMIIRGHFWS